MSEPVMLLQASLRDIASAVLAKDKPTKTIVLNDNGVEVGCVVIIKGGENSRLVRSAIEALQLK